MDQEYCNQCGNHCPKDDLRCGRGRRLFGAAPGETAEGGRGTSGGTIGLLRQCGHLLHHGGVSGDDLLSALSAREQAELERLLNALLADWKSRMPASAGDARHGHHR